MDRLQTQSCGLILVIIITLSNIAEGAVAEWGMNNDWTGYKQGSDITITCIGRELGYIDVVSIVKQVGNTVEPVMENEVVASGYRDTGRYTESIYNYDQDMMKGTITLKIKNLQGMDGGIIGCKAKNSVTTYMSLDVAIPVTEVYFSKVNSSKFEERLPGGSTVTLKHGEAEGFVCHVIIDGSTVTPEVKITVGDRDETLRFTDDVSNKDTTSGGVPLYYRDHSLSYRTLGPEGDYNGKTVTCEAYTQGFEDQKKSNSISLIVEYPPKLTCVYYDNFALIGTDAVMQCSVQSNPAAAVTWQWGKNGDENTLTEGSEGKLTSTEMERDGDITNVTLTVKAVDKDYYSYKYTITAENEYGLDSAILNLYEGERSGEVSGTSVLYQPIPQFIIMACLVVVQRLC